MSNSTRTGDVRDLNPTAEEYEGVSTNSCLISDLSIPVFDEILFKLPIKDVMRCKCVCKDWNNLLSSPNFTQDYAKNSPFTSILRCMSPGRFHTVPNVSYLFEMSENGDCIQAPFNPKLPPGLTGKWSLTCVGSCNGFVCTKAEKDGVDIIHITNPIMGDPVALPRRERDAAVICLARYNFGYSPFVNQYKVLRIDFHSSKEGNKQVCYIFTVGIDRTWRRFPDPFTYFSYLPFCIALNGAFHWLPRDRGLGIISTFDIAGEKFGQIALPPSLLHVSSQIQLAAFGNHLGLFDFSDPSKVSLWRMKESPDVEYWNKVSVLTSLFPPAPMPIHLVSVMELKNGDMLFSYSTSDFISCSIEQKKCSKIEVNGHGSLCYHSLMTFTPNFSSSVKLIMERQGNTANVQSR